MTALSDDAVMVDVDDETGSARQQDDVTEPQLRLRSELKDLIDSGGVVIEGKRATRGRRGRRLIDELLEDDEIRAEFLCDVDLSSLESSDDGEITDEEVEEEVSMSADEEDEGREVGEDGEEGEEDKKNEGAASNESAQ